jgi:hypothetical protein
MTDFASEKFALFEEASNNGNSPYYHSCCFSFSTKHQTSRLHHPESETMTYKKFKKHYHVTDIHSFAKALTDIAHNLPEPFKSHKPLFNADHNQLLTLGKRRTTELLHKQEIEQLKDELHDVNFMKNHQFEALKFHIKRSAALETELNKLKFFLRYNRIEPDLVLEGQTPSRNAELSRYAPNNLSWPSRLASFKTTTAYHPSFKLSIPFIQSGKMIYEEEYHDWLMYYYPAELQKLQALDPAAPSEKDFTPYKPRLASQHHVMPKFG